VVRFGERKVEVLFEKEYIEKLNMKLANINHQLQSDTEIDKIRSELVNLAG